MKHKKNFLGIVACVGIFCTEIERASAELAPSDQKQLADLYHSTYIDWQKKSEAQDLLTKGQDLTVCLSEAVDSAHSDVRDLSFQLGKKEIGLNFSGFNIWTEGDLDDAQGNSYLILKTENASNYKIQMRATTKMLDEYQKGDTAQDLGLTFPHTNVHEVKTDAISGRIEISSEKNGLVFYSTVDGNHLEITLWSKRTLTTNDVRFFELMISSIEVVSKGKSV